MPKMEIQKVQCTRNQLSSAPHDALVFHFAVSRIANEIAFASKQIIFSLNHDEEEAAVSADSRTAQALFNIRILAGITFEGWDFLSSNYGRVRDHFEPFLSDEAKEARQALRRYFGRKNLLRQIRNKGGFHVDWEFVEQGINAFPSDEALESFIGPEAGNCCFFGAELMTVFSMKEALPAGSLQDALEKIADDVIGISHELNTLLHDFALIFVVNHYPEHTVPAGGHPSIEGPAIDKVVTPFFCAVPEKS